MEKRDSRDPEMYFVSIFGDPADATWGVALRRPSSGAELDDRARQSSRDVSGVLWREPR